MTLSLLRRWAVASPSSFSRIRSFRSNAGLEALAKASEEKTPIIALYNYPSFSVAFSALFARLFHSHLNLPCFILPFSSVEPLGCWREISFEDLIDKGNSYMSTRHYAAKKLLDKVFKVRLGRGFYGECLGLRFYGDSKLSDEIGKELGIKSAAAGLRHMAEVVPQVLAPL